MTNLLRAAQLGLRPAGADPWAGVGACSLFTAARRAPSLNDQAVSLSIFCVLTGRFFLMYSLRSCSRCSCLTYEKGLSDGSNSAWAGFNCCFLASFQGPTCDICH